MDSGGAPLQGHLVEAEHRRQSAGAAACELRDPAALHSALRSALRAGPNPLAEARHVGRGLERERSEAETVHGGLPNVIGGYVTANAAKGHRFWFFLDVTVTYFS